MNFRKYITENNQKKTGIISESKEEIPESINNFLKEFSEVDIFVSDIEKAVGMSKFVTSPKDRAFLFVFEKEGDYIFHTMGMNFPISIYFFNEQGELVHKGTYLPNIKEIKCPFQFKYVIETTHL